VRASAATVGPVTGRRDLVVAVGSAGGVEALKQFVRGLPGDLPATVLVGLHLPPTARSMLPTILERLTTLRVCAAETGLRLEPGMVVVSQPDHHLVVVGDELVLGRGARENGHRPSHDVTLRSAAIARGHRTIGVVLTGLLDDGAAGLAVVRRYGGHCLVQDPVDAEFDSMPKAALRAVPDAVPLPLPELVREVARAVSEESLPLPPVVSAEQRALDEAELASALALPTTMADGEPPGEPSPYSCPDCNGVLNWVPDDEVARFRCRTGHAWTADSLAAQQDLGAEAALWTALRMVEERAELSRRLGAEAADRGRRLSADHFRERAEEAEATAEALRQLLRQGAVGVDA
jgi:two-component system chemotaxis response regulator CheB